MSDPARSLLMIAARAPISGQTKTRLGNAIGMKTAATLYEAFLRDLADRFDTDEVALDRGYDLAWTFSPPDHDFRCDLERVTGRATPERTLFVAQDGPDWAVRQSNLLKWGNQQGYCRIVLMASDSPHLARDTIERAFDTLVDHDVVLGRVADGGYYLIGMVGNHDLLSSVRMSTSSAADGVVSASNALGLTVGETPATFDIDEAADLHYLIDELKANPDLCPATRTALEELGLTPSPLA